jgi:hypothetical protein
MNYTNKKNNKVNKVLLGLLSLTSASAFAVENAAFQRLDTQVSLGYAFSQMSLANGAQNQTLQQSQTISLDAERLFDVGVWVDINAYIVSSTNSLGNSAIGTGQGPVQPATQDPFLGGVNAKVGYAFPLINQTIQLTPYLLLGRNTNLAMSTILANNYSNVTNDYFYSGGLGGRLEYLVLPMLDLYLDQSIVYNWDQSAPLNGVQPQNNMVYTTTLGIKYNVSKFLLGANVFYNNYQAMAAAPMSTQLSGGNVINNGDQVSVYQPQNNFGGMITVGMTY